MPDNSKLINELRSIVGEAHVLDGAQDTERHRSDFTGRFKTDHAVVVFPANAGEVAAVLKLCSDEQIAVVPQGGNSSLVGGAVALAGEITLSTNRMAEVENLNEAVGEITVQSGVKLAGVHAAANAAGWAYAVDIPSREMATIGGNIATNAAGFGVIRYGPTRSQVLGVELVTGNGTVIDALAGSWRNNTGFNLPSLVTGSEGTLGVVTRARLALVPQLALRTTALIRFKRHTDAASAAETIRKSLPDAEAIELFFDAGLELVCSTLNLPLPFGESEGGYVLVEVAANDDPTGELGAVAEALSGVVDVAVAEDAAGRERLWRYRESFKQALGPIGPAHSLDVAVPGGTLAEFIEAVPAVVAKTTADAKTWLFGHGGESSIHVNITGVPMSERAVDNAIFDLVMKMGGTVVPEYGVGRTNPALVSKVRGDDDSNLMRQLKAVFDPAGILNPAVLFSA